MDSEEMSACISEKLEEGMDLDQAVAACLSMAEEGDKSGGDKADLQFKDFTFEVKAVSAEKRTVEGYAATYDQDQVGDVILPGAFKKSLTERFKTGKIKLLWQHMDPLGVPVEMKEDEKGLFVKCKVSKTQLGDDALQLVKDGVIDRFSIGFSVPAGKAMMDDDGVRRIAEVKLYEVSLVTFAANEAAVLTAVKSVRQNMENKEPAQGQGSRKSHSGAPNDGPPENEIDPEEAKSFLQSIDEIRTFASNRLY